MALSRTQGTALFTAQSNAAAGTTSSSTVTMGNASQLAYIYGKLTNGATGPTVPARVKVEVDKGSGTWFETATICSGNSTANAVIPFEYLIPFPVYAWRITILDNTGQAVVIDAAYDLLNSAA